ncbi:sporulation histidine kinase inhibitor Sda [Bacillus sp. HNG]|nr:sporulation histidine kinase inhibitor Sda [Bacillus sp. HNG]RFB11474.1 sporulation histidine kinase inhibitor Sda [Bacillus sp. HNG]
MGFNTLSNEELIGVYLLATRKQLENSFLELLLDEIKQRNIEATLFETIN